MKWFEKQMVFFVLVFLCSDCHASHLDTDPKMEIKDSSLTRIKRNTESGTFENLFSAIASLNPIKQMKMPDISFFNKPVPQQITRGVGGPTKRNVFGKRHKPRQSTLQLTKNNNNIIKKLINNNNNIVKKSLRFTNNNLPINDIELGRSGSVRLSGRLVTSPRPSSQFSRTPGSSFSRTPSSSFSRTTPRPSSFFSGNTVTAPTITISSTAGSIRLIQPIQVVDSPILNTPSTPTRLTQVGGTSVGVTTFDPNLTPSKFENLFSNQRPQTPFQSNRQQQHQHQQQQQQQQLPRRPKQGPSDTSGPALEGFPNGLPSLTPLGVRIALENMIGNGEDMPPIPGEAGTDYPVFENVPDTGFSCSSQNFAGIYADTGSDCQAFYMCQPNGEENAFLCPNGTIFNQQYFICDWWYNIDCASQPDFYSLNEFIYETPADAKNCKTLFCIND